MSTDPKSGSSTVDGDHDRNNPIVSNLADIHARMQRAERDSDRAVGTVNLVCVTKMVSPDAIHLALAAGERKFGENRIQEAQVKWPALKAIYPDIELHLIGPLQSNKVREAVALFDVIETVDRPKIAEAIALEMQRAGRRPRIFVEINTGSEPQKAGVLPRQADAFLDECASVHGLTIDGLMCIPPEPGQKSPHFALIADIAKKRGIANLSMGMSADFELAIQLGATHVRVGSAIFGRRG